MLNLLSFICIIIGIFTIFQLKPFEFSNEIYKLIMSNKKKGIKAEVKELKNQVKPNFIKKEIIEIEKILEITNRENKMPLIFGISILMFTIGLCIATMFSNMFLVPVLSTGFLFVPFWWVKLSSNNYKKEINSELETALSVITTAYLRNEDIVTSVEETIENLNEPVYTVFKEFLTQVKVVNPDIIVGLRNLKEKVDNVVFKEWIDAMILCQNDRNLKTVLVPIVRKLSDMRIVNLELESLVFEPRKEFLTMVSLVLFNIPLCRMLNKSWYETLMHNPIGQITLAVICTIIFISTGIVIKLTKPIEYKR